MVDLGAIQRRQWEKERVPAYTMGNPAVAIPVAVPPVNGELSVRDAIEQAAAVLGADGLHIDAVRTCGFVGPDQNGNAVFQVVAVVSEVDSE